MRWIRLAWLLGLVAIIACAESRADETRPATSADAAAPHEVEHVANGGPVLEAVSPSGLRVSLRTEPDPPEPGPLRVFITVLNEPASSPRSIDLVSPTMPMHGITRFALERAGEAWVTDIEIPMEGEWSIYVNFDDGTDAAEVRFAVGDATSHSHHPTEEDQP